MQQVPLMLDPTSDHERVTAKPDTLARTTRGWMRLVLVASCLVGNTACVAGALDQLAKPAATQDMSTVLRELRIGHELGKVVQEVLDVVDANLVDDHWQDEVDASAARIVDAAATVLAQHGRDASVAERAAMFLAVRDTLRAQALTAGPHDLAAVRADVAKALGETLDKDLDASVRTSVTAAIAGASDVPLDPALTGPAPFTRLLSRNVTLGMLDGLETMDAEPLHRFLHDERIAFGDATEDSIAWWQFSFWLASAAALAGLLALGMMIRRDVGLRRRNAHTLRFLAGALKARESDPAMRDLLTAIADPRDPAAAANLTQFYEEHPDMRIDIRTGSTTPPSVEPR